MANKLLPVAKGDTELENIPQWTADRNNYIQNAQFYAGSKFKEMFGRNPTSSELAMLWGSYDAGNRVDLNLGAGDSAVAQYYQAQLNSPENQKDEADTKLKDDIPKQYDAVKQTFQSAYGRDPSQAELDHFSTMMAKGEADAYSIQQGLQTLPEYTNARDTEARTKLRSELQAADSDFLVKQVAPELQSRFAQQGRVTDSSSQALAAAFANASKETNNQREQYLATVGRDDYTNARQSTINNYLQTLQRQYQMNDMSTGRMNQLQDMSTARQYELGDYHMQQQAYNAYLQNSGRRKTGGSIFGGALQGGIGGATAGGMAGGPWGAVIGGLAGAGLGAYGASQQKSSQY